MGQAGQEMTVLSKQLSFGLAGEVYGVDVLSVREIRSWMPVTRVPQMPPHVLGVLNIYGDVVPVLDLRARFGLEQAACDASKVLIVLALAGRPCAIAVDAVSDVLDIDMADLQPAPALGASQQGRCIKGLANHAGRLVMLLDAEKLLHSPTLHVAGVPRANARDLALAA